MGNDMKEFIDKTTTQNGTKIDRAAMLAIQGFEAKTTIMKSDGSIEEANSAGEKLTTKFESNKVIETLVGVKTITKTTTFNADGSISEVLS